MNLTPNPSEIHIHLFQPNPALRSQLLSCAADFRSSVHTYSVTLLSHTI